MPEVPAIGLRPAWGCGSVSKVLAQQHAALGTTTSTAGTDTVVPTSILRTLGAEAGDQQFRVSLPS